MMETTTCEAIKRLALSHFAGADREFRSEVGTNTAEWTRRGMPLSSGRVVGAKSAGEKSLVKRAEITKQAIIDVCKSQNLARNSELGHELIAIFDEIYKQQIPIVRDFIERSIPNEAKALCPVGELRPEIHMYREELLMFADQLPHADHWANIVLWFRSRPWSILVVMLVVCIPLLVQWIEMVKVILDWIGVVD